MYTNITNTNISAFCKFVFIRLSTKQNTVHPPSLHRRKNLSTPLNKAEGRDVFRHPKHPTYALHTIARMQLYMHTYSCNCLYYCNDHPNLSANRNTFYDIWSMNFPKSTASYLKNVYPMRDRVINKRTRLYRYYQLIIVSLKYFPLCRRA